MMSLKEISSVELALVSGGVNVVPADYSVEQFLASFLATVTTDELKDFARNNVHVHVDVQVYYYSQLDSSDIQDL